MDGRTVGLIALAAAVCCGGIVGCIGVSYSNQEVRLRARAEAQQRANTASFDTCWKVIAQTAQVSDQYREAFKDIYPALMAGRYGNARGGALMSWVSEANPQFSPALYEKVAAAIEAQRLGFKRDQQMLLDIKREHDALRGTFPASVFVGGRAPLAVQIVTSERTEATFAAGREDDVRVFDPKR